MSVFFIGNVSCRMPHARLHAMSMLHIFASAESALDAITTGATAPQSIPAVVAPAKRVMVL